MDPKHQIPLGYALVQYLALSVACARAPSPEEPAPPPPPPPKPTEHYVAPGGNDSWEGSKERPFETIARALAEDVSRIVLLGGEFAEPELNIERSVSIEGIEGERSILKGRVFLTAPSSTLRRLELEQGLAVHRAAGTTLDTLKISTAQGEDTLSFVSSTAQAAQLELSCGLETCLQSTTSTVHIQGLTAVAQPGTKRGVRVESSSVSITRVRVEGASITQVQASQQSSLTVEDAELVDASGNALAALQESSLRAQGVRVVSPARFGLLVQTSQAQIESSTIGASRALTVGISGSEVSMRGMLIQGGPEGAISINNHTSADAQVTIQGSRIEHGTHSGVLMASGALTVISSSFVGAEPAGTKPADALTVSGLDSALTLQEVTISSPTGFGVALTNDASGLISATIEQPGLGGVILDQARTDPVVLQALQVSGCRQGSGVVLFGASNVRLEQVQVQSCPEAGLLAGDRSEAEVRDSAFIDNAQYGIAAFGGSVLQVQNTQVRGSKWSLFASCGDGARVEDLEGNTIKGPSNTCP